MFNASLQLLLLLLLLTKQINYFSKNNTKNVFYCIMCPYFPHMEPLHVPVKLAINGLQSFMTFQHLSVVILMASK